MARETAFLTKKLIVDDPQYRHEPTLCGGLRCNIFADFRRLISLNLTFGSHN